MLNGGESNYRGEAAYLPLLLAGIVLGASFLFGDGIISPAISVLAAVEDQGSGLKAEQRY